MGFGGSAQTIRNTTGINSVFSRKPGTYGNCRDQLSLLYIPSKMDTLSSNAYIGSISDNHSLTTVKSDG